MKFTFPNGLTLWTAYKTLNLNQDAECLLLSIKCSHENGLLPSFNMDIKIDQPEVECKYTRDKISLFGMKKNNRRLREIIYKQACVGMKNTKYASQWLSSYCDFMSSLNW